MSGYKAPNGKLIDRIFETTPCAVGITSISDDGKQVEYDGHGSDMLWDEQKPIERNGSFVFLDEDGGEWTFDQLTKVED